MLWALGGLQPDTTALRGLLCVSGHSVAWQPLCNCCMTRTFQCRSPAANGSCWRVTGLYYVRQNLISNCVPLWAPDTDTNSVHFCNRTAEVRYTGVIHTRSQAAAVRKKSSE
ncbi:hypothetical protein I79_002414 [Cricetulus griseus]|uniref:Uncharacterized protein n=1 Tax=Cricetulus griseus TaxID=10029 RepID=G3GXC4_CRIGR|nr:hypothetical protein I79_002414 [Cricetulus griseus]